MSDKDLEWLVRGNPDKAIAEIATLRAALAEVHRERDAWKKDAKHLDDRSEANYRRALAAESQRDRAVEALTDLFKWGAAGHNLKNIAPWERAAALLKEFK